MRRERVVIADVENEVNGPGGGIRRQLRQKRRGPVQRLRQYMAPIACLRERRTQDLSVRISSCVRSRQEVNSLVSVPFASTSDISYVRWAK